MKHNNTRLKPITGIILLLVAFGIPVVFAAPPTGIQVYPKINNAQEIELIGGVSETASWPVPSPGTYQVWVQIPPTSNASHASYFVYPNGTVEGNTACDSSHSTYPCFQIAVDQATANTGWVQLKLNNDTATSWLFSQSGYVSISASGISSKEQLGVGEVIFQPLLSSQSTNTPATGPVFTIGQSYQGGKIFYIDDSKQHGLIAALYDQSEGLPWDNGNNIKIGETGVAIGKDITLGATGITIGSGQANTAIIVKAQGGGNYAASVCDDLAAGGYTNWYLPAKEELDQLYINQTEVGGFASKNYWSSTEDSSGYAWGQSFFNGYQYADSVGSLFAVRCIRAF